MPCPIALCRTDDRFKLLRKKKAAYATGTTNYVTLHKCTLFWGFLGTGVFSKVRMITAKEGNSSFKDVGQAEGSPKRSLHLRKSEASKPLTHSSRKSG